MRFHCPPGPKIGSILPIDADGVALDGPGNSLFVVGNYAYVANTTRDSLAVIDISNPKVPVVVANGGSPSNCFAINCWVYVQGHYAYFVRYSDTDSLLVYDISNPVAPVLVTRKNFAGTFFTCNFSSLMSLSNMSYPR